MDYCAKNGVCGFIVWGFLRDCHGGVKAATELCAYAADRGVAVLPGVGLCSYGGYYFEGNHPFNLDTYLRRHPERVSTAFEQGSTLQVQAPSRQPCSPISGTNAKPPRFSTCSWPSLRVKRCIV